jgi:hypothetical protein
MIAGSGAMEFFALTLLSLVHRELVDAVVWAVCAVAMFVGVFLAENAKSIGGQ